MRDESKLKFKEFETREQYIYRIYSEKILNQMTNKECSDIINRELGTSFQESYLRGIYTNYAKGYEDCLEKAKNDLETRAMIELDNKKAELEEKTQRLIEERKKLQATKIEKNKQDIQKSRKELFYENIGNYIERFPMPVEASHRERGLKLKCRGRAEDIQVITDIHYGANFKSTNNEYSREIAKERFDLLLNETINYCLKNEVETLKVLELGDTIQGMLRISDVKLNEVSVVQSVVEVSRLIANYLNRLSEYVDIEYYQIIRSNHSQTRPLGTKASEIASEDLQYVIGNYIKDLLSDNVAVTVTLAEKDYLNLNICGYECIALHGHQIKNIKNMVKDYSMLHQRFYQYAFLGHFHGGQTMSVGEGVDNNIEVLLSPSFIGSDSYSDSLSVGAKAMCRIYRFEVGNGLTRMENIILN